MSSWRSRAKSLNAGNAEAPEQPSKDAALTGPTSSQPAAPTSAKSSDDSAVPNAWQPLDPAAAFESAAKKQDEREQLKRRNTRKRIAWFEWLAIASVVAGLLGFATLRWIGKPLPDEAGVVAEDTPASRPMAEVASDVPESHSVPADSESFEKRKQNAIADVLEDAGDGSFALGGTGSSDEPTPLADPSPVEPMSPAATSSETAATPRTKAKTKRKFASPLKPGEILMIARDLSGPEPQTPPRRELALPMRTPSSYLFKRLYKDAFDQHQSYLAAKKSNAGDLIDQLLESIQLFEQCLARPSAEVSAQQRLQIMTTLAGLHRSAGRLYDASVYATHVIRVASPDSPLAVPAATVGFAVLQEAVQANYSDLRTVSSLDLLTRLCDLVESRGIEHPQLDTMRYATAQLIEQQGLHDRAAVNYLRVNPSSELFGKAMLAAGRQLWKEAKWREANDHSKQIEAIVSTAARSLDQSINAFAEQDLVTPPLLAGRVARAQIALRRDDTELALAQLDDESGVLAQIENGISMPSDFVTLVYELHFEAYSRSGDYAALRSTLDRLAERYGEEGSDRITALYKSLTRDFLRSLEDKSTITSNDVDELSELLAAAVSDDATPALEVILWASETWAGLIGKGEGASVRESCLQKADQLLRSAIGRDGLSDSQRLTLELRRVDLMEQNDELQRAYELSSEILQRTPAILDLQIRATDLLFRMAAESRDPKRYSEIIEGREGDAVWGWLKLTNTLVKLHYESDDKTLYLDRLLRCGYEVNRNRLRQAAVTDSLFEKTQLRKAAEKHINQLLVTFARSSDEWTSKLGQLRRSISDGG